MRLAHLNSPRPRSGNLLWRSGLLLAGLGGLGSLLWGEPAPGTLDEAFMEEITMVGNAVYAIAVDGEGRILVGGSFVQVGGEERQNLVRLLPDGRLDPSFAPGSGTNRPVHAIALQEDGKILIGGSFTRYRGQTLRYLARLEEDGSIDRTFNYGIGPNHEIQSIALTGEGEILLGGGFFRFSGQPVLQLTRLDGEGRRQESFHQHHRQEGRETSPIHVILPIEEEALLVAGGPFSFLPDQREGVVKLFANGQPDPGFRQLPGDEFRVRAMARQSTGQIIIGGSFSRLDSVARPRLARLGPYGDLDSNFARGQGTNHWVDALLVDEQDRILVGGRFTSLGNHWANRLLRLLPDGEPDPAFQFGQGADGDVFALAFDAEGGLLVGGAFRHIQGQPRALLARLHLDSGGRPAQVALADPTVPVVTDREPSEPAQPAAPPPVTPDPPPPAPPERVSATIDPRQLFAEERRTVALHRVRPGDEIARLAQIYDVPEEDIRLVNGLGPHDPLPVGAMIVMEALDEEEKAALLGDLETVAPPPSATSAREGRLPLDETRWVHHRVASGDTLFRLARQYNTNVAQIKADNQLTSDVIRIGQTLRIRATPER